MKCIFTFIAIFFLIESYSQNFIFIGTKSYIATNQWGFVPPKRTFTNDEITIQVGKASTTNGVLMISVSSEFGQASIVGSAIVYLKDGSVISLTSIIASDYANDKITVIYSLIQSSISKIRVSNIMTIRFNYINPLGSEMGISAQNGQFYNNGMFTSKTSEFQTSTEVEDLFAK
jgi:hypothetical protein